MGGACSTREGVQKYIQSSGLPLTTRSVIAQSV